MLEARSLATLREGERALYFSEIKCGLFSLVYFIRSSDKPIVI